GVVFIGGNHPTESLESSSATTLGLLEIRNSSQLLAPGSCSLPVASWPPHGDGHRAGPDAGLAFEQRGLLDRDHTRLPECSMPSSEGGLAVPPGEAPRAKD